MNFPHRLRLQLKAFAANSIKKQLLAGRFASKSFRFASLDGQEAVVVMCLWNRSVRMPEILRQLDAQDHPAGVRLYLWNNKRSEHGHYLAALKAHTSSGALRRVDIVKSPFNLGAIARFYWVRKLVLGGYTGPVVTLDDDEDVQPAFVSTAVAAYRPRTLTAWWAFTLGDGYWDRTPATPGDRVDYAGTGGMVLDPAVFSDTGFFTGMPQQFWFLDDMWLNYFAKKQGYTFAKLDVQIDFVMHETNQFHEQVYLKEDFYNYLYPPAA